MKSRDAFLPDFPISIFAEIHRQPCRCNCLLVGWKHGVLPFTSVNFNRQKRANGLSSCKFTVPKNAAGKRFSPGYGATLLIVTFFGGGSCLKHKFLMLSMNFSCYKNVKLKVYTQKCWQNNKHAMYSQFRTPILDASFWNQCNKHNRTCLILSYQF